MRVEVEEEIEGLVDQLQRASWKNRDSVISEGVTHRKFFRAMILAFYRAYNLSRYNRMWEPEQSRVEVAASCLIMGVTPIESKASP